MSWHAWRTLRRCGYFDEGLGFSTMATHGMPCRLSTTRATQRGRLRFGSSQALYLVMLHVKMLSRNSCKSNPYIPCACPTLQHAVIHTVPVQPESTHARSMTAANWREACCWLRWHVPARNHRGCGGPPARSAQPAARGRPAIGRPSAGEGQKSAARTRPVSAAMASLLTKRTNFPHRTR